MKPTKKRFVLLPLLLAAILCVLCLPSCGGTQERRYGSYRYIVENGEVTITEYTGVAADVTIPDTIKDMPVVAIGGVGWDAFSLRVTLKSVTIPDSVREIGWGAFDSCASLERVTLGKGVTVIDAYAFDGCLKLSCNEYEGGVYLATEDNPYYALLSMDADVKAPVFHPDTRIICGYALKGCKKLGDLVIPEGILSVASYAFPELDTVSFPSTMAYISSSVFYMSDTLEEITVAEGNTHYKSVDGSLFTYDGRILMKYAAPATVTAYTVPDGTVIIESDAFINVKGLTEVTLPDSVEEIGHMAFCRCEDLTSIDLGNGLKRIDGAAFNGCTSLIEIAIPDSVEDVSYSVFAGCYNLTKAVIGAGVTNMDRDVFESCELTEVVFRDSEGWKVNAMYSLRSTPVDVSDPEKAAEYLTGEYCDYYWRKD